MKCKQIKGKFPDVRESQLVTWKTVPNTGMAVITDCGDRKNIHPPKKGLTKKAVAKTINSLMLKC